MKINKYITMFALIVIVATMALINFVPPKHVVKASPAPQAGVTATTDDIREFATTYGAGEIVVAINPANGHIAALLTDEANNTAAGYYVNAYETAEVAHGTFTLTRRGVFNNGTFPESITLTLGIPSSTAIGVVMDESGMSLAERPGHPCYNASGTGQCNEVNTKGDWWRCFRCCLMWEVLQNPCGDFV